MKQRARLCSREVLYKFWRRREKGKEKVHGEERGTVMDANDEEVEEERKKIMCRW